MIRFTINGEDYDTLISKSITVSLNSLCNTFSFTTNLSNGKPIIKQGDLVVGYVNDVKKVTGTIRKIEGSESEGSESITYSGRDKTDNFVDSSLDVINDIRASGDLTLSKIIETVIQHLNSDLTVVDLLKPPPFNETEDIITPEAGQNAYDFIMSYAKKRQALLTSDGDGNIVITGNNADNSNAYLQWLRSSTSNNILTQNFSIDGTQIFNKYVARGQLDPVSLNEGGSSSSESIENQNGVYIDNSVSKGRQNVIVEKESYSSEQLKNRATWNSQLLRSKATVFSCTSEGHVNSNGGVWDINTLVQINSELADITRVMLLNNITFSEGEGVGAASSLEFVEKNSYTIESKLLAQKPVGELNDGFRFTSSIPS